MIQKNERRKYVSDLSDSQWAIIEPLFPRAGNRNNWEKRELVDAVLYFVDNGCKWRNLLYEALRDKDFTLEELERRITPQALYAFCGIVRKAKPRGRPRKQKDGETT